MTNSTAAPNHPSRKHLNECHIRGILARDPEVRKTQTGKIVANVTVTTTYEQHTEYHLVACWEELAQRLSDRFHKGDYIKIVGRLQTRSYEKNGQRLYTTQVVAWNLSDGKAEPNAHGVAIDDSEIPF